MARKIGKFPIPTSLEMMPVPSQFAFLAMATWSLARDSSSIIHSQLEEVRRPLKEYGYTPLLWEPEIVPHDPDYSLLTSDEGATLDALPVWENHNVEASKEADEWITHVLLRDPQRSRPIAWYLLQFNPWIKKLARSWFPAEISFWPSPFPATTPAELWVIFLAAFEIMPDNVGRALRRAGEQLLVPIFYPQTLPVWQLLEVFFRTIDHQFDDPDTTLETIRNTLEEAKCELRITISEIDDRARYLRITPALSQEQAKDAVTALYKYQLPAMWHSTSSKPTINPTHKGTPAWWQQWDTIISRACLYAELRWNNLPLQKAAIKIGRAYSETGASDLKKELNAFESVLALATNTIKREH